jgi:hypothetical protein
MPGSPSSSGTTRANVHLARCLAASLLRPRRPGARPTPASCRPGRHSAVVGRARSGSADTRGWS